MFLKRNYRLVDFVYCLVLSMGGQKMKSGGKYCKPKERKVPYWENYDLYKKTGQIA